MAEINITPLTDVMMVLLIIFIITATAITQAGFEIKLPRARTPQTLQKGEIQIYLPPTGEIYLGANRVSLAELKKYLNDFKKKNYQTAIIKADDRINYGKVITVMDIVRDSGFSDIALAVDKL